MEKLNEAYERLYKATESAFAATEALLEAEITLEVNIAQGMKEGTIDGKNKDVREANARTVYHDQFMAVEEASKASRQAKHELELANINLRHIEAMASFLGAMASFLGAG